MKSNLFSEFYCSAFARSSYQVHCQAAAKSKHHDKYQVEQEVPQSQHDFQGAEIGDLCGRSRDHEGSRAAETHPLPQPLLEKRDCSAAAGVKGNADGGGHQHAEGFVAAEQRGHGFCRNITLEQS